MISSLYMLGKQNARHVTQWPMYSENNICSTFQDYTHVRNKTTKLPTHTVIIDMVLVNNMVPMANL